MPHNNQHAQCAAAGMYLKGEGGAANHSHAVELYEAAAKQGSIKALNGLGYAYFFGNHLPQNLTKVMVVYIVTAPRP